MTFALIGDVASRSRGFSAFAVVCLVAVLWFFAVTLLNEVVSKHFPAWRSDHNNQELMFSVGFGGLGLFLYFMGVHALNTTSLTGGQVFALIFAPLCFGVAYWAWKHNRSHPGQRLIHFLAVAFSVLCGLLLLTQVF